MTSEPTSTGHEDQKINVKYQGGSSGPVYGLGLIGAMAFYFSRATTFQQGVLGFFKGIFWPAILVFELLKFLTKE